YLFCRQHAHRRHLPSFPTRRSSDLAEESDGVQLMKPIPGLDDILQRAVGKGFFGTKMRSVIKEGNDGGVKAIADQQFEVGRQIADRKSTRLNSSHLVISYAVFCLKK